MNILLGISGSIAAFKMFDLTRLLSKEGHTVRVVLTQGALEFVKPELFRYLGAEAVLMPGDDFKSQAAGVPHVDLSKWADVFAIAPLSANTLSKLSRGGCDDFLSSLFLAWRQDRPVLMFPAMNTMMWQHEFTQDNVKKMNKLPWVKLIDPTHGLLACGDLGAGKLMEVEAIADLIQTYNPLKIWNKKVLITTGATVAPLDPVRFMTNPSSGLTGVELAKAYLKAGAEVTLLVGHPTPPGVLGIKSHPRCRVIETPKTNDMLDAAKKHAPDASTIIAAAAVADFEFKSFDHKIKKEVISSLSVEKSTDVLAELLKSRGQNQKFVSFAAETDTTEEVFREKMRRKPVDLMVGNTVDSGLMGAPQTGFKSLDGTYWFVLPTRTLSPQKLTKKFLAEKILAWDQTGEIH